MKNQYPITVRWSEEDDAYIGTLHGLAGDCCHGDDVESVLAQCEEIAADIIDELSQAGKSLPKPEFVEAEVDSVVIRKALGMSQPEFANWLGIPLKTLQKWDQGETKPSGAAKSLLKVAALESAAVMRALSLP